MPDFERENQSLLKVESVNSGSFSKNVYKDGKNALHYAASSNDFQLAESLVQGEFESDKQDKSGQTALHYAAFSGNSEMVKLLISKIDPNIKDDKGRTALHYAVMGGNNEAVKLLTAVTDNNIQDKSGKTALHYAVISGNKEMIESILPNSDPNIKDSKVRRPIHYAIARDAGKVFLKEYLNDSSLINEVNNASSNNKSMASKILLADKRVKIYKADKDDVTPLEMAISSGNVDAAKKLIARGADVERVSKSKTPLMMAVERYNNAETKEKESKSLEIIKSLVESGANPEKTAGGLLSYKAPISIASGEAKTYLDEVVLNSRKLYEIKRSNLNEERKLALALSEFNHLEGHHKINEFLKKADDHAEVIRVASNLKKSSRGIDL